MRTPKTSIIFITALQPPSFSRCQVPTECFTAFPLPHPTGKFSEGTERGKICRLLPSHSQSKGSLGAAPGPCALCCLLHGTAWDPEAVAKAGPTPGPGSGCRLLLCEPSVLLGKGGGGGGLFAWKGAVSREACSYLRR